MKTRLDIYLTDNGYFETREKAKAAIMAGLVFVNGQRSDKGIKRKAQQRKRGNGKPKQIYNGNAAIHGINRTYTRTIER